MEIVCKRCDHRFEQSPGSDAPGAGTACPQCGTSADAKGASMRPRALGDYEILEEVSRGAMGVIYKARHKKLRRIVALKVMIAGQYASAEQIARFEKEARAAAKLRHANIVPIYEIGAEGGNRFFTMGFVDGTPLDVLIARGDLAPRDALKIAAAVGDALAYAHEQGVIHRDIKPSNIMIDRSGRPQIMDFGLAKQTDSDSRFTRTGTTIGTPSYMPPEQARGENKAIDQRSDVYSLGAVLYEMLTGRPPFTGETMMNIVMKVIHDQPAPFRRFVPKMHRDIETIVFKAMEKEPRRRYQGMSEFADDVRRYLAGEMLSARPAGPFLRAARTLRKHRSPVIVGLVIGVLTAAVFGVIVHVLLRKEAEQKRRTELAESELLLRTAEQEPVWTQYLGDTFSEPKLAKTWRPSGGEWRIVEGRLVVRAAGETFILLNDPIKGNAVIEFTASADAAQARINCFLGESRRAGYTLRFGGGQGKALSLYRLGLLLAEIQAPPIEPKVPYSFRIEWRGTSLTCRVSGGGKTHELRYDNPALVRGPGPFFGFYTWGCTVRFDDLRISREEFASERLNKLQAIESNMLSYGNLKGAMDKYAEIIEKHGGKPIAVLAEHKRGLVQEALGPDARTGWAPALQYYRNVEQKRSLLGEKRQTVLAKNKERVFFLLVRMGRYEQAAKELTVFCRSGRIDAGAVWQFPAVLSQCVGDRAYGPALDMMQNVRFTGLHATLRAQWWVAGPGARSAFGKGVHDICTGLGGQRQYDGMKRAFAALPDLRAVPAFEAAIAREVAANDAPKALDLLWFASEHGMAGPRLERSAVSLAQHFIASKQYARVVNVHRAYPAPSLVSAFDQAISGLVGSGDLAGATDLFAEACDRFWANRGALVPSGDLLMGRLLKSGQFADVVSVHALVGDARLAGRLLQAAQGQLDAGDLPGTHATLEYVRTNVPERREALAPMAAALAARLVASDRLARAADLFEQFPDPRMAEPFAAALTAGSLADDRALLRRLMTQAILNFRSEPRVAAAVERAARSLISVRAGGSVLDVYERAARARAAEKDKAAAIRLDAARILLAGEDYRRAAAAFASAAATPAKGSQTAATAAARAAAIWQYLGEAGKAETGWDLIVEQYPAAFAEVAVASLMNGSLDPDEFVQWLAANPKSLEPGEGDFYLALRAKVVGREKTAAELFRLAVTEGKDAWFEGIARDELRGPFTPGAGGVLNGE